MTAAAPAISEATTKASKKEQEHITTRFIKEIGFMIRLDNDPKNGPTYINETGKYINIQPGGKRFISDTCPVKPTECSIARAKREFKKSARIAAGAPDQKAIAMQNSKHVTSHKGGASSQQISYACSDYNPNGSMGI